MARLHDGLPIDAFEYDARLEAMAKILAGTSTVFWRVCPSKENVYYSIPKDGPSLSEVVHGDTKPGDCPIQLCYEPPEGVSEFLWRGGLEDFLMKLGKLAPGAGLLGMSTVFDFDLPHGWSRPEYKEPA